MINTGYPYYDKGKGEQPLPLVTSNYSNAAYDPGVMRDSQSYIRLRLDL